MKTKLAAALAAVALLVGGCSAGDGNATLTEWIAGVGLSDSLTEVSNAMGALGKDLEGLTGTDLEAVADAMITRGAEVAQAAKDIAGEAVSNDAEYERLRQAAADAIAGFSAATEDLKQATDATRADLVNAATAKLTDMTVAIKALGDYIAAHGDDPVSAG